MRRAAIIITILAAACLGWVVGQRGYVFSGVLLPSIVTQVKAPTTGLIYRAFMHANAEERFDGDLTNSECPIRHVHIRCKWDSETSAEAWSWEYRTKKMPIEH